MNKEICFIVEGKELILEQVLIRYNSSYVFFICKDKDGTYYTALDLECKNELYLIVESAVADIINMLIGNITMRNILLNKDTCWLVNSGVDVWHDTCIKFKPSLISPDVLPLEKSYFNLIEEEHKLFFQKLINGEAFK